jgi:hypothetical protein
MHTRRTVARSIGIVLWLVSAAVQAADTLTPFVSEENQPATCKNSPVKKVQCRGNDCDSMALVCLDPRSRPVAFDGAQRVWLPPTKQGEWSICDINSFVTGIDCQGDFCSTVSIECTKAFASANRCYSATGAGAALLTENWGGVLRTYASVREAAAGGGDSALRNWSPKSGSFLCGIVCVDKYCGSIDLYYCYPTAG